MLNIIEDSYCCLNCKDLNVDPYQSSCGCRYCYNCINKLETCVECPEPIHPYHKDKAFKREIDNKWYKCSLCEWSGKVIEYQQHYNKLHLKKVCKICNTEVDDLQQHSVEYAETHHEMLGDLYNELKKLKEKDNQNVNVNIDDLINVLKDDSMNLIKKLENYKSYCQKLENELKQTQKTLMLQQTSIISLEERLNTTANICKSGEFLWKITNVKDKFLEAKGGRQTSFYSVPFFTSEYGYKLCGRVYLNGDGCGKGTHLSLFITVMRGPNDNLLSWPFKEKITFTLLDQHSNKEIRENICDSFRPDPKSNSFSKPTGEMNIASGIPLFCPLSKLFSSDHDYLKDDCLFIKITVNSTSNF